jgi:hypothetical protein
MTAPAYVRLDTVAPRLLRAVPSEPSYEDGTATPLVTAPLVLGLHRMRPELDLPELARLGSDPEAAALPAGSALENDLRRLFGVRRTPRTELPDPAPRAATAVRLLLEVLTGDRPTRQVSGWVSPRVLAGLENRSPHQHRSMPRRPLLRSLRVTEPGDGVAEVSAVVATGPRCRAVALRLDGLDGRWTVTALHVG